MMDRETSGGLPFRRGRFALPSGSAVVAILLGVAGICWLLSVQLATPDMRLGVLTQASMVSGDSQMGMSGSMSMSMGSFIVVWTVMMVAMMIPSVLPAVRRFDTWAHAMGQPGGAPVLFTIGYLLVWSGVGALAYLVVQALQSGLPTGSMTAFRVGAVLLVVAGAYQLTPVKEACLRRCRSPYSRVALPASGFVLGYPGTVRAGFWSGVYCLGSSWPLMLVLLLVGMMNLVWMAVIAAVIFVEKVVPGGVTVSKAVGWGLVGWGIFLLVAPQAWI